MADGTGGVAVALISLFVTIVVMFAHMVRTLARLELKTEEMWSWFIGAARNGLGRRKTDRMLLNGVEHLRGIPRDEDPES